MSGLDAIGTAGVIVERLRDTLYRIELANGHRLHGFLPGKLRERGLELRVGDRVEVEMTPFDLSKGRIVSRDERRLRDESTSLG